MNQRPCSNCSSMVDEAKAFCPECGSSMEAEQERKVASEFDQFDETQHYGKTAYGMLMQQMELDISSSPESKAQTDEPEADQFEGSPETTSNRLYLFIGIASSILILAILVVFIVGAYFAMT